MTALLWIFATPLVVWMAGAGLAGLAGHRSAVETFDRLGYSPARRMAAAVAELLSATGILLGAAFPDMAIGVSGTVAANFITGLTWFVIGNSDASHRDKVGGWAVTILATGYLVTLMIR